MEKGAKTAAGGKSGSATPARPSDRDA